MDKYAVVVKITFARQAESLDDALRKALSELPDDAIVLEAMAFPARVPQHPPSPKSQKG